MTFEQLQEILAEQFSCEPADITAATQIEEDLGADELDWTELCWQLSDAMGYELDQDALREECPTAGLLWRELQREG